jgi:hypothetical protein
MKIKTFYLFDPIGYFMDMQEGTVLVFVRECIVLFRQVQTAQ